MSKIALVDDDRNILTSVAMTLEAEGFEVETYNDGQSALDAFSKKMPDMAVFDIKMPRMDGMDLLQRVRQKSKMPVIFLTSKDDEIDEVLGLRMGADDYVTKDMSLEHLLARITALLRRAEAWAEALQKPDDILTRGKLTLNVDRMTVAWQGQPVDLTVTEFWMLHALVQHPGHVRSREQLMEAASTVLDDNTVTSHIKRIRRKFSQLDDQFDGIQTAYGMGYRWNAREV